MADQLSDESLEAVVELQRVELNRLLAENGHLYELADRLLKFVERDQVLRQQMQNQIAGLQERLALPSPETRRLESRLNETEGNLSLLKQALWKLVVLLEGKDERKHGPQGACILKGNPNYPTPDDRAGLNPEVDPSDGYDGRAFQPGIHGDVC